MDEKEEVKETKEQSKNIDIKSIVLLLIRIIICLCVTCYSIQFIPESLDDRTESMTQSIDNTQLIVSSYNSRYETYVGNNLSAFHVRSLLRMVMAHNANISEVNEYGSIQVKYLKNGSSGDDFYSDSENINDVIKHLRNSGFYQVRVSYYDDYGFVSRIVIIEQLRRDDIVDIDMNQYHDILGSNLNSDITSNNTSYNSYATSKDTSIVLDYYKICLIVGIIILFYTIMMINSFIVLIKRKFGRIYSIIDLIQIVLLFLFIEVSLLVFSLRLLDYEVLLSTLLIVLFICLIIFFIGYIKLFKKEYEKTILNSTMLLVLSCFPILIWEEILHFYMLP